MLVYIAFGLPMLLAVALLAADVYYLRLLVLIMLNDDLDPGVSIRQYSPSVADDLADRRARRGDAS